MKEAISSALNIAKELCIKYEGLRLRPYICPAGYATIGYGTVYKPDGTRVTMQHPPISKQLAEDWMLFDLKNKYMLGVLSASPTLIKCPRALGALTDFAYNLGVPRYRASSLKRAVNAGDWSTAKTEILKWTRGGGKVLPGLVARRKSEAAYL